MKKIITALFSVALLLSCGGGKQEKDMVEQGNMLTSSANDTCLCDVLAEDSLTGLMVLDDAPYTGVCMHNYPNSENTYMVKNLLKGKLHGKTSYYDKQGNLLMEEVYQNGDKKRSGENAPLSCNCNELVTKKQGITLLDGIPFTGKCEESYPDIQQVYMEISYSEGLKDGFTIFYDRLGKTMYMEKYENGKLLKVIHDGQR